MESKKIEEIKEFFTTIDALNAFRACEIYKTMNSEANELECLDAMTDFIESRQLFDRFVDDNLVKTYEKLIDISELVGQNKTKERLIREKEIIEKRLDKSIHGRLN